MNVALFFGSFNPVHVGHMIIAQSVLEEPDIDQLWFIVSPQNPFKKKESLLDERQRLHLVNLAIDGNHNMRASDIEFSLPQPSYTIDTLVHLEEKFPNHSFYLTMGSDNLEHLHKWKNADILMQEYTILVYPRPGSENLNKPEIKTLQILDTHLLDISATVIRDRIANDKSAKYFLTEPVLKYLEEMNFYRNKQT